MKKKILLVDNDQLILYALSKTLENDSCEVSVAASANTAIEKLSSCPYDLCLLDIHLRDCNGLQLMKIIEEICPKTKVAIMTADCLDYPDLSNDICDVIEKGACHFIVKPFELCDVVDVVRQLLFEEQDSQEGFRFTGNGFAKKTRKNHRSPFYRNFRFQMTVIHQGESKRLSIDAKSIDVSDGGVGLMTTYPLKTSQVIGFGEDLDRRTGVVAWSSMIDDHTCRAGVKFA